MNSLKLSVLIVGILGAGALFGFYFTMSVSIMPGLDQTDPYAAIVANQDIGHATQQSWFFVALLGTPIALIAASALHWRALATRNWLILSVVGWVAMMVVTLTLNVPLNQVLDGLVITPDQENLADLWASYSVDWQKWNLLRVLTSGVSLAGFAMALQSKHGSSKVAADGDGGQTKDHVQ